jgi:hypothetical protein
MAAALHVGHLGCNLLGVGVDTLGRPQSCRCQKKPRQETSAAHLGLLSEADVRAVCQIDHRSVAADQDLDEHSTTQDSVC